LQGKQRNSKAGEEELLVVSNSSVIIALARIYRPGLLEELFGKSLSPEAVWQKVTVEGKPGRKRILRAEFIHLEKAGDGRLVVLLGEFGR